MTPNYNVYKKKNIKTCQVKINNGEGTAAPLSQQQQRIFYTI